MVIEKIIEHKNIVPYINSHNLLIQYKKAKEKILSGDLKSVSFRKRKPYKSEKYYFKINSKYRAFVYIEGNTLKVFESMIIKIKLVKPKGNLTYTFQSGVDCINTGFEGYGRVNLN